MNDSCVILLVEDNQDDAFLISGAFRKLGFPGRLQHAWDAEMARSYLTGGVPFNNREEHPLPRLIITDAVLNHHGTGYDLLKWVRQQPSLEGLPCVLFSGTVPPKMEREAEAARVDAILIKSVNPAENVRALREALLFLPTECREWLK